MAWRSDLRGVGWFVLASAFCIACTTTDGAGSETHLLCTSDSECGDPSGAKTRCVQNRCVAVMASGTDAATGAGGAGGATGAGGAGGAPVGGAGGLVNSDAAAPAKDAAPPEVETTLPEPTLPAVLDRPSTLAVTCSVTRPPEPLGIDDPAVLRDAVSFGAEVHLLWSELTPSFAPPSERLMMAGLGSDGVRQPAKLVFDPPAPGAQFTARMTAVARPDRFTVWWDHISNDEVTPLPGPGPVPPPNPIDPSSGVLQFDSGGGPLGTVRPVDHTYFSFEGSVRASKDGYLAAWSNSPSSSTALRLARLDAEARPVGFIDLQQGPGPTEAVTDVAESGDDVSLVYQRSQGDQHVMLYRRFGASGAPVGAATRFDAPEPFYRAAALLPRGTDVLVAWQVIEGKDLSVDHTHSSVRLARFGADGKPRGEVLVLASDDAGLDHYYSASWVDLGDSIGLVWAREHKIDSACDAGCQWTGTVHFVAFAPDDLTRHSEPIELRVDGPDLPGLGVFRVAPLGNDLLLVMNRFVQSYGEFGWSRLVASPVSATLRCAH